MHVKLERRSQRQRHKKVADNILRQRKSRWTLIKSTILLKVVECDAQIWEGFHNVFTIMESRSSLIAWFDVQLSGQ